MNGFGPLGLATDLDDIDTALLFLEILLLYRYVLLLLVLLVYLTVEP